MYRGRLAVCFRPFSICLHGLVRQPLDLRPGDRSTRLTTAALLEVVWLFYPAQSSFSPMMLLRRCNHDGQCRAIALLLAFGCLTGVFYLFSVLFFFSPITSSFLLVVLHFLFTHVPISRFTKQAAQRRQLQTNNRRACTRAPDSTTRLQTTWWGEGVSRVDVARLQKKGGRGELWKEVSPAKVGTRARRSASSISFFFFLINVFSHCFLCSHLFPFPYFSSYV